MLGKLIKHEFIASYRVYLPVYLGVLLLSLMAVVSYESSQELLFLMMFSMMLLIMGAMGIFILYNLILSLGIRVYGKPGYLLFSIPAKTGEIIFAKVLVNVIWILCTGIVCLISIWITFRPLAGSEILGQLGMIFGEYFQQEPNVLWTLVVYGLVSVLYQIGFFLFLFALLHLIYKGEKKGLVGVLLYIGLTTVIDTILRTFTGNNGELLGNIDSFGDSLGSWWISIGVYAILAGILYFFSYQIMDKKMELQ